VNKPVLGLLLGGALGALDGLTALILIGTVIAALLALPIALHADPVTGRRYIWEIMIPGSIVGLIVGYATQRFGQPAAQRS
jgi:hypothetical protein